MYRYNIYIYTLGITYNSWRISFSRSALAICRSRRRGFKAAAQRFQLGSTSGQPLKSGSNIMSLTRSQGYPISAYIYIYDRYHYIYPSLSIYIPRSYISMFKMFKEHEEFPPWDKRPWSKQKRFETFRRTETPENSSLWEKFIYSQMLHTGFIPSDLFEEHWELFSS